MRSKVILGVLVLSLIVLSGCFTFVDMDAPSSVETNSSFDIVVVVRATSDITGSFNMNQGYFAIEVPEDWTVNSMNFSYDNVTFIPMTYSTNLPAALKANQEGYKWVAYFIDDIIANQNDLMYMKTIVSTDSSVTGDLLLRSAVYHSSTGWQYSTDGVGIQDVDISVLDLLLDNYQCRVNDNNMFVNHLGTTQVHGNLYAFAAILQNGSVVAWGDPRYGGDSSAIQSELYDITHIFSNYRSFAALRDDGEVIVWGDAFGYDMNLPLLLSDINQTYTNVHSIYSNSNAYAFLRNDGTAFSIGHGNFGGDITCSDATVSLDCVSVSPSELTNIVDIRGTVDSGSSGSFAALKSDGSVITWGNQEFGGNSTYVQSQLTNVEKLFSTKDSFAALKSDGSVVSWGAADFDAGSSYITYFSVASDLINVENITASSAAFAALKSDGSVITWGDPSEGAIPFSKRDSLSENVTRIYSNHNAFAAVKEGGSVVTWGSDLDGGDSSAVQSQLTNVKKIFSTWQAFAALKENGEVVVWGKDSTLHDAANVPAGTDLTTIAHVFSTQDAFAILRNDGSLTSWGDDSFNSAGYLMRKNLTDVLHVFTTQHAFTAIHQNGSVSTWGDWNYGADPDYITNIGENVLQRLNDQNNPVQVINGGLSCIERLVSPTPVLGCTNSSANNYNSLATQDDGSCTYDSSATYYLDQDQDGFANQTQVSSTHPGENWYAIDMPVNDCDDTNRNVHPGFTEADLLCSNRIDDDCNGLIDSEEPVCQTSVCAANSIVFGVINNSRLYQTGENQTELCVDKSDIYEIDYRSSCGTSNDILAYNPNNNLVARPSDAESGYTQNICGPASCQIQSGSSCSGTFSKVLGLSDVVNATVSTPSEDSFYSLCCQTYQEGISFKSGTDTVNLYCSTESDGFCPEDFEDSEGNRISCSLQRDPDCGYQPLQGTQQFFKNLFSVNFDERVYVTDVSNSNSSRVAISQRNVSYDDSTTYINYSFSIVSSTHSDHSVTNINFSYAQGEPTVKFDGSTLSECPSTVTESDVPCYEWEGESLTLHHTLSVHTATVEFSFRSAMTFIFLVFLFAILVPLLVVVLVKTKAFTHMRGINKKGVEKDISKLTAFVEKKLSEGLSKADIRRMLEDVGWEHHVISLALHGAHVQHKNYSALQRYIKECLDKNIPKSKIFAALLAAGWEKEEVNTEYEKLTK